MMIEWMYPSLNTKITRAVSINLPHDFNPSTSQHIFSAVRCISSHRLGSERWTSSSIPRKRWWWRPPAEESLPPWSSGRKPPLMSSLLPSSGCWLNYHSCASSFTPEVTQIEFCPGLTVGTIAIPIVTLKINVHCPMIKEKFSFKLSIFWRVYKYNCLTHRVQGWAGIPVSRDSREYKPQISLPFPWHFIISLPVPGKRKFGPGI